jgi:hypothetical protein
VILRAVFLVALVWWLMFWALVVIGRWEADPWAVVVGAVLLVGYIGFRWRGSP